MPTIVQIEAGYYYMLRGFTWKDFQNDISKFNAIPIEWKAKNIPKLLKFAKKNKSTLPFRHHFRDFMIGTECAALELDLITNNSKHFQWIPNIRIYTPEQFIQKLIAENEDEKNENDVG